MEAISDCWQLKVNLKDKIYLYVNSTTQGVQKNKLKLSRLEICVKFLKKCFIFSAKNPDLVSASVHLAQKMREKTIFAKNSARWRWMMCRSGACGSSGSRRSRRSTSGTGRRSRSSPGAFKGITYQFKGIVSQNSQGHVLATFSWPNKNLTSQFFFSICHMRLILQGEDVWSSWPWSTYWRY